MFDFNAAIASVQAAAEAQAKTLSMPEWTVEETSEQLERALEADLVESYAGFLPPVAAPTIALSAVEKLARNEMNGLGAGLTITGA